MSELKLCWKRSEVAPEVAAMLEILAAEYPLCEGGDGVELAFVPAGRTGVSNVRNDGRKITVEYGSLTAAARGVGTALAGLSGDSETTFETYGIMLDASRNGVMTVAHFKKWLRQLALYGYNMAMLYCEDTYKLPDEPYFGYLRGAYTMEELREIDDYAAGLGIEMIACIQTLGHMEQIIKWGAAYRGVTDTARVMNVGEDATYKLIEKMLDFWGKAFRSRRIHIGMDETHDLGRGRFLDKYGYVNGFELFNRHLGRVNDLCKARGLAPMIWSDMYFRLGNSNQEYYDLESNIPAEVRAKIPENVELVYWDYYHGDYDFYRDFIKLHQQLNRPVALGSGVWTWSKFWYDHVQTKNTVTPGLKACRDTGVKDVFFTMWGDDGAFCAWDSSMAGLAFAAELAYSGEADENAAAARFAAISQGDYAAHVLAGSLDLHGDKFPDWSAVPAYRLFWDDPLLGIGYNCYQVLQPGFEQRMIAACRAIIAGLAAKRDGDGCADLNHPCLIAEALIKKLEFRGKLVSCYLAGDRPAVAALAADIPGIVETYERVSESFRSVWNSTFKPFGFEVIQIRNAGQIARWRELERRLLEYAANKLASIEELEEKPGVEGADVPIWTRGVQTASSIL
ncbi:MAG: family 20 glycosylhydrolase [Victivallaceae bacterium]|nr:family 20 glycosylhydrolase [Victivallaceae bacterium]